MKIISYYLYRVAHSLVLTTMFMITLKIITNWVGNIWLAISFDLFIFIWFVLGYFMEKPKELNEFEKRIEKLSQYYEEMLKKEKETDEIH